MSSGLNAPGTSPLHARRVSLRAKATLASRYTGRIVGTYTSGLIALDGLGRPLHLTSDGGVVGPFTLQLAVSARSFGDTIGSQPPVSPVTSDGPRLRVGPWTVDATRAAPWSAEFDWAILRGRVGAWLPIVNQTDCDTFHTRSSGWEAKVEARLEIRTRALCEAMREFDSGRIELASREMAGLGPGLTPAGDDYLAGALLALRTAQPSLRDSLTFAIVAGVRGRTSRISWAIVQAASLGEAAEPWHHLAEALARADSRAAAQAAEGVRRIGHSTGFWSLRGFLETLLIVNDTERAASRPPSP